MTGEKFDAEAFLRVLALHVPQYGNILMIIKQQLEQKIIEKNLQLGEQYCVGKCRKKDNQGGIRSCLHYAEERHWLQH